MAVQLRQRKPSAGREQTPRLVPTRDEHLALPLRLAQRERRLEGLIAPGWMVVRSLPVTWERDDDGFYVLSDNLFGVYGDGNTPAQTLQDYVVSLIDYYELLAVRATEDDLPTQAEFSRLRQYLKNTSLQTDVGLHPGLRRLPTTSARGSLSAL